MISSSTWRYHLGGTIANKSGIVRHNIKPLNNCKFWLKVALLGVWMMLRRVCSKGQSHQQHYWRNLLLVTGTLFGGGALAGRWLEKRVRQRHRQDPYAEFYDVAHAEMVRALPLKHLSRFAGRVSMIESPRCFATFLKHLFVYVAGIDLSDAADSNIANYRSVQAIFTRDIHPSKLIISPEAKMVSPCNGTVSDIGPVKSNWVRQIKHQRFNLNQFMYNDPNMDQRRLLKDPVNNDLYHIIYYLAPRDYHHFHSCCDASWNERLHVPPVIYGALGGITKGLFRQVLALNERVMYKGTWRHGFMCEAFVGALLVGSVAVDRDPELRMPTKIKCLSHKKFHEPLLTSKGGHFGKFLFGSTIVVFFEAPKDTQFCIKAGDTVRCGEKIF